MTRHILVNKHMEPMKSAPKLETLPEFFSTLGHRSDRDGHVVPNANKELVSEHWVRALRKIAIFKVAHTVVRLP